jgi:hypothetical protein
MSDQVGGGLGLGRVRDLHQLEVLAHGFLHWSQESPRHAARELDHVAPIGGHDRGHGK